VRHQGNYLYYLATASNFFDIIWQLGALGYTQQENALAARHHRSLSGMI